MTSKREDLLAAAKKLMWEHGYEAMSPRDLLKESGAGQGSLYHFFDGKLDLAITAIEEISEEMQDLTALLMPKSRSGLKRAESYLSLVRDGIKGCRLGRFASEAAIGEPRFREPISRYFADLERQLAEALKDAQRDGEITSAVPPAKLATMLIAVVQGGFLLSRVHQNQNEIKTATAAAVTLLRSTKTVQ